MKRMVWVLICLLLLPMATYARGANNDHNPHRVVCGKSAVAGAGGETIGSGCIVKR